MCVCECLRHSAHLLFTLVVLKLARHVPCATFVISELKVLVSCAKFIIDIIFLIIFFSLLKVFEQ